MNSHTSDQQPKGFLEDYKNGLYLLVFICQALAVSVEVFLHRRMGARSIGGRGLAAAIVIPLWSMFWPGQNYRPLLWFWAAFLVMCLLTRICAMWHAARGEAGHSRDSGIPRLQRLLPRCSERRIKGGLEPLVVMLTGAIGLAWSQPLGSYLIVAAFGLLVTMCLTDAVERTQAMDMNDALIAQRSAAERLRHMQNGRA